MDDGYTAEHIHQALASDERVSEPELRVQVVAGRVVITGDVHTEARRDAVADVVREVD
ncbi:MAG: BON domain-containing protein, partial [Actinomycetota bacterium]